MAAMTDPHQISTVQDLLALYGEPYPNSLRKEVANLTPAYQRWIEAAPFLAVSTVGGGDAAGLVAPGGLDCSPRGDRPGHLVTVLDAHTIAIPDRRGNNRLDTLRNLIADPRIALLFLVPGVPECVRINGTAIITTDPGLKQRFTVDGHEPASVILVTIESVYFQCARAIIRSQLWEPASQADPASLPTAGEMSRSGDVTSDASIDAAAYDATLRARQRATLY